MLIYLENTQKIINFAASYQKDMSTLKGLNDRVGILNNLRFYFRYEQQLLQEGWMSESDFFKEVEQLIREYAISLLKE